MPAQRVSGHRTEAQLVERDQERQRLVPQTQRRLVVSRAPARVGGRVESETGMTDHTAETGAMAYFLSRETDVVHTFGCRYPHGTLDWPRWPGLRPRACKVCLPDGLPEWERDPVYRGMGRLVTRPGGSM